MRADLLALTFGGFWSDIGRSLREAFYMFWDTLWALILGFTLSGAVQAFVSRRAMQRHLGGRGPASIGRASLYGMVSSSCSYAASAMARSLFARGADFLAAMVFMFASTNLVVELGIVLLVLIGWQFLAAEFVGGAIMIVLLVTVGGLWLRGRAVVEARRQVEAASSGGHEHSGGDSEAALEREGWRRRIRTRGGWSDAAGYTMSDLTMLRKELVIGFTIAGFLTVLVPTHVWSDVFIKGHGFWTSVENAVVGPFVAVISFVCSVGNVPLAAALWKGGISFGGVVAFVFADLITLPLLLIYRKQYGGRMALRMLAVFWAVMSAAGLATEYIFRALGWIPTAKPGEVVGDTVQWNYTTVLNIVGLIAFGLLYWLYRNRERFGGGAGYAKDPVCGMQVETAHAPATLVHQGQRIYFCSEHCADRFGATPDRYVGAGPPGGGEGDGGGVDLATLDPVCGMTVDRAHAAATVTHRGRIISFCAPGCAESFRADPDRFLPEETVDPVCGMSVRPESAAAYRRGEGQALWFCSTGCARQWDASRSVPVQLRGRPM
ncbi:MAG TPA: permease [Acidimicrobiales bacterium]|nr:permease [Acidimicrobiales bacterium]